MTAPTEDEQFAQGKLLTAEPNESGAEDGDNTEFEAQNEISQIDWSDVSTACTPQTPRCVTSYKTKEIDGRDIMKELELAEASQPPV